MLRHGKRKHSGSSISTDAPGHDKTLFELLEELEYADDAALIDEDAESASERVSRLAAGAMQDADMEISVPKTEAMHVQQQMAISPVRRSDYDIKEVTKVLQYQCSYCGDGFDTKQGRNQHITTCGLATREVHAEEFEVEAVIDARGPPEHRYYKVLWKGYAESDEYWEPWRHLLNSAAATDKFWAQSELNEESCIEVEGESRCKWCCRLYTGDYAARSLKSHYTRVCDHEPKSRAGTRAERAVMRQKRKAAQDTLDKVVLQGKGLRNVYEFKYLGHWFTADAGRRYAANVSMAKAKARFGQLWRIWDSSAFPITAKVRLFGAAVVSILLYGSEAWHLDDKLEASLRGWCAKCMVHISGRSVRDECVSPSFPSVAKVRQKRLKWLGHVLRSGEESLVRQAVIKLYRGCVEGSRQAEGTVVMDAPKCSTVEELIEAAGDREAWNLLTNAFCPTIRRQRNGKQGGKQGSIDILVANEYATKMQEELIFMG
jgi:hypothetical protein